MRAGAASCRLVPRPDPRPDREGPLQGGDGNPVGTDHAAAAGTEPRPFPHDHGVVLRAQLEDVERFPVGNAQSPPLADRVTVHPLMLPQDVAGGVHDRAGAGRPRAVGGAAPLHERRVIAVGNEADLLALRLFGDRKVVGAGDPAHFLLVESAEREQGPRELGLGEFEQEIGLVLVAVRGLIEHEPPAPRVASHARVVPGGDARGTRLFRQSQQPGELHPGVAADAGGGGQAGEVISDEGAHDLPLELLPEIGHVERDPQVRGHRAGVPQIVGGAASIRAGIPGPAGRGMLPELHGETNQVAAGLLQEEGGDRTVHAPAHGDGHSFHGSGPPGHP